MGTALAQPVRVETVATGLQNPWGLAHLPDGRFLVTERPGRMRVVESNGKLGEPLAGVPAVAAGGQGGLLDVVLDSDFAANRTLFFCFSEPGPGGNSTALARARLSADATRLDDVKVIFSQKPKVTSSLHFGCRIVENRQPGQNGKSDGLLFLALGERYQRKDDAQKLDNHHGKIVRIRKDGTVPADNPFVARAGALPEIWSYGHRNPQGATLSPDGTLWMHEHGPQPWVALREGLREHEGEELAVRLMAGFELGATVEAGESMSELRNLLNRMLVERLKVQETEAIHAAKTDPGALQRYRELQARRLKLESVPSPPD